jgi:drug/metabolite transporter (DMT)-like permease
MLWLIIIIIAYFLNASATVVDKFLLTKKIPNPAVYAFFICFLNLLGLVFIPFGFHFTSWTQTLIALINGVLFTFAYLFMFMALNRNEASRITPFMGGLQPIFVLLLAFILLGERISGLAFLAFAVIVLGTIVLSYQKEKIKKLIASSKSSYWLAVVATILFAAAYTLNKYIFVTEGFVTGFVLVRIGTFLGALLLLLRPQNIRDIINEIKVPKKSANGLFLIGQGAGALSLILVSYAVAISKSVAIINASRGLEYVFLLIIVLLLARKHPHLLEEKLTPPIIFQKAAAVALIIAGLIILALV